MDVDFKSIKKGNTDRKNDLKDKDKRRFMTKKRFSEQGVMEEIVLKCRQEHPNDYEHLEY